LIILSNVDRASFAANNARLGVNFDAILTAEDVDSYKPSPRTFAVLAQRAAALGIRSGWLLHVAQSLFHDHVPAKRARLRTVWINRRHDRPGGGATPNPRSDVTPDWEFPTMAAFAEACAHDKRRTS
jgi:2-haloacid dehalogenase